jgi:hypothetical protein
LASPVAEVENSATYPLRFRPCWLMLILAACSRLC